MCLFANTFIFLKIQQICGLAKKHACGEGKGVVSRKRSYFFEIAPLPHVFVFRQRCDDVINISQVPVDPFDRFWIVLRLIDDAF